MSDPRPNKKLGQHWLSDKKSLTAIVDSADIKTGDTVLEIGPGTGLLTKELATRNASIIALEYDNYWLNRLHKEYSNNSSVKVIYGDIRTYTLEDLPKNYKIVANIPYYLTANLLRKLIDTSNQPLTASLLVQKEVAQRVAASPGSLSLIAVLTQLCYQVSLGSVVPAQLFNPPPKVDSQIVILKRHVNPEYQLTEKIISVVKAGFSQKRKKIKTSLMHALELSRNEADDLLARAKVNGDLRAQDLTLGDWHRLSVQT